MNSIPAILGGKPAFDQLVPIVRPVLPQLPEIADDLQSILSSGQITKGRFMLQFEQAVADHLGVRHAVAVSSCTSGLILAQKSLGLTGEVVVPSFTFMATAGSLVWNGLQPVFADVNRQTNNIDPAAAEAAITPRTSALLAVHQFGNPADIAALQAVADRHGLKMIYDAAHGFGACYQGEPVGKQADAQVFSLSPTKLLITGEGGIVATNDETLAEQIRMGREYGNDGHYNTAFVGLNARLPEFNAILGLRSLDNLEHAAQSRNETAALFQEVIGSLPGVGFQHVRPGDRHGYREFSITIEADEFGMSRDDLSLALSAEKIDNRKYYDPAVHRQTAFQKYYQGEALPNTDWLASHSLSFPMWTDMDPQVALGIGQAVQKIHLHSGEIRSKLHGN